MEFVDPQGDEAAVEAHRVTVSEAVRKLSEAAGVPEGLRIIERPSGAPYVVPAAAGADPAPYHLFKGGLYDDCGYPGCGLDQSAPVHQRPEPIDVTNGTDAGIVLIPGHQSPPKVFEDYCTHPNGFGPMGCPCGASADDPDEEIRFRHIPTGADEVTLDCPSCHQLIPAAVISNHLRDDHLPEWPRDRVRKFMEDHGLEAQIVAEETRSVPLRCPLSNECADLRFTLEGLREHLPEKHDVDPQHMSIYLTDPWREDEERADWKNRTFHNRYGMTGDKLREALSSEKLADQMQQNLVPKMVTDMQSAMATAVDRFLNADVSIDALAGSDETQMERLLTEWWMDRAEEESRTVIPKAIEYGSNSLMEQGRRMAKLQGRTVSDEEALELGCWDYAAGKMERWTDAVLRGDRPSDDTLYDIGIYIKMAQRVRDSGSWPGV